MDCNDKKQANFFDESLLTLRISEKIVHFRNLLWISDNHQNSKEFWDRNLLAVPRINTDAQAEKAKTCKDKLIKGIRQISPLA